MGELKPGWRRVKFGEVVRQVKERVDPETAGLERFVAGEHMDTDDLRIRRWGNIGDGYLGPAFHMRFRPGHVLYGSRRTYLRKVAIPDFEGICANTTFVLEPADSKALLPEMLPFIMQADAFHEHSKRESKGSVNPYVNFSDLAWYEFALPPLDEQQRIVEKLRAHQIVVEALLSVHEASGNALRSLQKEWFMTRAVGVLTEVGTVARVLNGTTPRRSEVAYWKGAIPWLPTGKVNERVISGADEFITERALKETSLSIVPSGATLVAMIGEGQTRGRAAMLGIDACINQNFGAIVPGPGLDPWFLFYQFDFLYESLRRWSHGTNQQALNCSLLRSFRIRVPPIEQQREIAGAFRQIETSREELARRGAAAKTMLRNGRETALV